MLTDARGLLLAITTTDFVSALVITNSCLKYLKALTASPQAEAKGIVTAVSDIDTVTASPQAEAKCIVTAVSEMDTVTASPQAEAKGIVTAVSEIDTVTATVQEVRDNIDTHHAQWFLTITEMSSEVGMALCTKEIWQTNTTEQRPS